MLVDKKRYSNIGDIRSFRGADSDTHRYLMVAEVRERDCEQAARNFHMGRFNLKNLSDVKVKGEYDVKISYGLAALGNLNQNGNASERI